MPIYQLPAEAVRAITEVFDDLMTQNGKLCRLVYQPVTNPCDCQADPIGNKPAARYQVGGPLPPGGFLCALCNDTGVREESQTEEINLVVNWQPREGHSAPVLQKYRELEHKFRVPFAYIEVRAYMTDLPKLKRATELVVQLPTEGFVRQRYRLVGDPADANTVIQNRYCVSIWERTL